MKSILSGFFCVIVVVAAISYSSTGAPSLFFKDPGIAPWGRTLLLALALVAGIFCGHLYSVISTPGQKPSFLGILQSALSHQSLWRALLGAPIVFGVVYVAAKGQPDLVLAVVFAFENGFICQTVLERRVSAVSTSGTDSAT